MNKFPQTTLTVRASHTITPNMQRITLQGDALAAFPPDCEGSYIKLLFNQSGGTDLTAMGEAERPVMRTYTIRRFDTDKQAIDIDFVRHLTEDLQCGFAARWAMQAQVGDPIQIAGPGAIRSMNSDADWFFMVADMTALPALSAKIRQLPGHARGYAVIKVLTAQDIQAVEAPKGMELFWLTGNESLADKARSLAWLDGTPDIWCACEFDTMRQLRQYFRNEKEVDRDSIYLSSYWKQGVTEDGHKVLKQQDNEAQQALSA